MIYLDNAATSFPKPEQVVEAVTKALLAPASPGRSGHRPALEASRVIFRARKKIATLFGLKGPERVVFTQNITWAINLAVSGLSFQEGDEIISTSLEHNSTARPLKLLHDHSHILWKTLHPQVSGIIEAKDILPLLNDKVKLVVLNHASNVTGAITPVKEIKKLIGDIPLLLDTAQSAGSYPMEDASDYADIITFTGHKGLLGPTGTGGLWVREGIELRPLAVGGSGSNSESLEHPKFLPDALEAGTLNTHGLAGLNAGVGYVLERGVENIRAHEMELTNIFLKEVETIPGLKVIGPALGIEERVATISITLEGYSSSDLGRLLEERYGIMIRCGLHCSPMAHETQGTYPAGASRFSFGVFNTKEHAHAAASALKELALARRGESQAL
jgi:cysteine desulfurase family protein